MSTAEATSPDVAPAEPARPPPARRKVVLWVVGAIVALIVLIAAVQWILHALRTISTDDAYVNGHVTFVAPRIAGQVQRVLVDDNNRVHKGDLLVQLDPEPYQ
ncbi:MAG TPA: biotin/lipoyl-binding protein, partial [Tepidisphaeraceae bacterium]